ncbi:hypothetical protein [Niabella sp.]|uniref:hypothetical protein n=1 Tax=Niabella sp. TaxID=1962976 RepID=UPI002633A185|nr:hypothetical protein [Niabella sp.]
MLACSKSNDKEDPTYPIHMYCRSAIQTQKTAISLKFKTSLQTEQTVVTPTNSSVVKVPVKAAIGEYVRFSISTNNAVIVKVYDPKGGQVVKYSGFSTIDPTVTNAIVYDFIAFNPNDQKTNPYSIKQALQRPLWIKF